jgi:hypothetical protein
VGVRNRQRRAAKKKARDRRSVREQREASYSYTYDPPLAEVVAEEVWETAHHYADGSLDVVAVCVKWLNDQPVRGVDKGVDMASRRAVACLWPHGWLPYDVVRHLSKQFGELESSLITDVIAADSAQYASVTVHERWQEQLRQIDATIWWEPGHPHLSQWLERHGCDRVDALTLSVTILAAMMAWPKLPLIVPPPGTAHATGGSVRHAWPRRSWPGSVACSPRPSRPSSRRRPRRFRPRLRS